MNMPHLPEDALNEAQVETVNRVEAALASAPVRRTLSWWQSVRDADARRTPLPGEQMVVLGLGLLMLVAASRSRSVSGKVAKAAVGGALVGRGLQGNATVGKLVQQAQQLAEHYVPR